MLRDGFRSRAALHREVVVLRQQVAVLKRRRPRPWLGMSDRLFWVVMCRVWPNWRRALVIVEPASVIGRHRKGFRLFRSWKSRRESSGRPPVSREIRDLIRGMSRESPLWGAPRIHGELLKIGFDVSEAAVSKYLTRHPKPLSQTWRTFLENHLACLASIDVFVVPTATFTLLFVFVVLRHERRRIVQFGVTAHPTAGVDSWADHRSVPMGHGTTVVPRQYRMQRVLDRADLHSVAPAKSLLAAWHVASARNASGSPSTRENASFNA